MSFPVTHDYSSSNSEDTFDSDDSQEDPTFDFLDETRSSFSRLSVKKKPKSRVKKKEEDTEEEPDVVEMVVPELDEKDQKNYDIIQKVIQEGEIQRLKVDQCKIYLRKHGLRLTGTKDILIQRIKEHLEIINGGGEKKYPPSSFVVNCQGDACTGDVVLFEQNVYEMFSIVSRCANGPPCGTRVIAGRIVKESYGAAKQQHTFTIEVLWSKGEKPLPPLHPLLIKGRNLYRLKTMRQKWEDEGERKRILTEKHARGCVARSKREARVQRREMRNKLKSNRVFESKDLNRNDEENRKLTANSLSIGLMNLANQPQQKAENVQDTGQAQCLKERPNASMKANMPFDRLRIQRQPLTSMNGNLFMVPLEMTTHGHYIKSKHSTSSRRPSFSDEGPEKHNMLASNINELSSAPVIYAYQKSINHETLKSSSQGHHGISMQKHFCHGNPNFNPVRSARQTHGHAPLKNFNTAEDLVPCSRPENSKLCRYYAQGRCYYGQNCRYLHPVMRQL